MIDIIPAYAISLTADGKGAATASSVLGKAGTEITITATPDEGYLFKGWEVVSGGVTLADSTAATTTFTLGSKDVQIKAVFEAKPVLTKLEITQLPSKTEYEEGETFDPSGMEVTVTYSNNTTRIVTDYTYEPVSPLTISDTSVEISYTEDGVTVSNTVIINTTAHVCGNVLPVPGKDATCTTDGWQAYYQCECQKLYADQACTDEITDLDAWKAGEGKIPAAHTYGDLIPAQSAVHTSTELKAPVAAHYPCVCGKYFDEDKVETTLNDLTGIISGHLFGDWITTDDAIHWKECSCTLKAYEGAHVYDDAYDTECNTCGHLREVTIPNPPVVTAPAKDQKIDLVEGESATLKVEAANGGAYQWYVTKKTGLEPQAIPGAVGASYALPAVSPDMNGYTYHCVVTNSDGSDTSPSFSLTVTAKIVVPSTGDNTPTMLWMSLMLLALAGCTVLALRWKHIKGN